MAEYSTDEILEDTEDEALGYSESPGDDIPVAPYDGLTVIQAILSCRDESEEARYNRDELNKINQDAAHCRQSFEGKVQGQSSEFVPKVPMALEQLAAFVKRGLVGFGNYFSVELSPNPSLVGGPLTDGGVVRLLRHRLEDPDELPPGALDFPTSVSDGVKIGALEASMIFKVCGTHVPTRRLVVRPVMESRTIQDPLTGTPYETEVQSDEELVMEEGSVWRLLVELVRPQDYFPDPTGRGLYEVHRTRKDLHQVIQEAEAGLYDPDAVAQLVESYSNYEVEQELERQTDQPITSRKSFRKEVELLEFWGTLLDSDGHVAHANCRAVIANEAYLISKPEPNPYWHQESPFVSVALLRVPFAVFHKALFDYAVRINLAMNELYNLIVDGGIGSVWGNRQVKMSRVENADDFTNGIPQGATFIVSEEHPDGAPVMMNTPSGIVPPEAMGVYQLMDREFASATMISETGRGQVPRKDVSATAVASADAASSVFFDSIIADLEAGIRRVLRLAWLTMLQNADDWNADDTAGCIGPEQAAALGQMSAAKRYATYAQGARFRVSGLSAMLARTREFQKIMSVMGAINQSPILAQVAMTKMSPEKLFYQLLRSINLDPDDLRITEEEKATMQERIGQLPQFQFGAGGQGGQQLQNDAMQQPGSPVQQVQSQIASLNQPPQGL